MMQGISPGWILVALFAAWILLWRRVNKEKKAPSGRVVIIIEGDE